MTRSPLRGALPIRSLRVSLLATALAGLPLAAAAQTAPPPAPQRPAQAVAKPKPVAPAAAAPQQAATTQGAAPAKSGAGDDVIARVGTTNISADQIRAYVASLGPRERAAVGQDPNLLSQAVRLMLANRLVLQEVAAKKW
ncbi:peptidylprolyl isomerase, partial [Bradyrhizobium sp. Arg237L]|nr:peptidylprolyl isomerase [Bradyrhizobium sp. Arg237L]